MVIFVYCALILVFLRENQQGSFPEQKHCWKFMKRHGESVNNILIQLEGNNFDFSKFPFLAKLCNRQKAKPTFLIISTIRQLKSLSPIKPIFSSKCKKSTLLNIQYTLSIYFQKNLHQQKYDSFSLDEYEQELLTLPSTEIFFWQNKVENSN